MAQKRAEQFPPERFAAAQEAAETSPAGVAVATTPPPPARPAAEARPAGVSAGNPFDDADFSAVLDAEMERRSTDREPALRVEPAVQQQPAAKPPTEENTRSREGSLEDEMARLLADMTASKRN
jgi:hypothetical protein